MSSGGPLTPYYSSPEVLTPPEPVYVQAPRPYEQPRQRVWLHVLLFVLTVASTVYVGGWVFSAGLLAILTCHEFGHYFTARKYRVAVSLPYFIPFPLSLFGTMGAFIRMSSRISDRRALFDIAAAGPLAGMVVALPLSYIGIVRSAVVYKGSIPSGTLELGDPLLFHWLTWLVHGSLGANKDLILDPLAFAGWAGMFVTALNLLPIGQLDGGHICHALFRQGSQWVARALFGGLAIYSIGSIVFKSYLDKMSSATYLPFLILLFFIGIKHPPTADDELPLGAGRQWLGFVLGATLVLCFSLVPIKL